MPVPRRADNTAANLGFEAQLGQAADALRGCMDAAEHKYVVLGPIFLKHISDAFEKQYIRLEAARRHGAHSENPEQYPPLKVFWVPPEVRWSRLKTKQPPASAARNRTTQPGGWRPMDLAIRDIDGPIAHGDTFHNARFPNLRVENIADPLFNVSDRRSELLRDDPQTGRAGCETRHLNTGTAS